MGETGSSSESPSGIAFKVDVRTGKVEELVEASLAMLGLKERADLQRWVTEHPRLVGNNLLLITTEFDRWQAKDIGVADRLDVLFLDQEGHPLVAELKRDQATDTVELQALKYAAFCSQLTVEDLAEEFARHHKLEVKDAHLALLDHAPMLGERGLGDVRIRLIAGGFSPSVTSLVLWLRDHDIDMGCVEVKARPADDSTLILTARQLIPLPQTEDYLVQRRRKEQKEHQVREQVDFTWADYEAKYRPELVATARELWNRVAEYVETNELDWVPVQKSYYMGWKRNGKFAVGVTFWRRNKVIFAIRCPHDPTQDGHTSPYPALSLRWNDYDRQWEWTIEELAQVPDVAPAIDLVLAYEKSEDGTS